MTLRPLVEADRAEYLRAVRISGGALARFMPILREGESEDEMFDRQMRFMAIEGAQGKCFRTVGVTADGRIAGGFNLNAIGRGLECRADITCWVAADVMGQGLAAEGLSALVEYGLADLPEGLGLHTIEGWVSDDNVASQRLAERAGFAMQEKQRYLNTGDRWAMHRMYVRRASV